MFENNFPFLLEFNEFQKFKIHFYIINLTSSISFKWMFNLADT